MDSHGNEPLNYEKIARAKQIAEQAIRARKVYRLDGGHRYLRQALKKRGWVEKFTNRTKRFQTGDDGNEPMDRTDDPNDPNNDEADAIDPNEIRGTVPEIDETDHLVSRALRDHEPNLMWMPTHRIDFKSTRPDTILNHYHKADFVTKTGLTERLESTRWYSDRSPDEFFPKCYILGNKEGYDLFLEDFRRCAATSFLKHANDQLISNVSESANKKNFNWVSSEHLDFAIETTKENYKTNVSTTASTIYRNTSASNEAEALKEKWDKFLEVFYLVAHQGHMISGVIDRAIKIGEAISLYQANHGQHHIEGQKNLWILKPGAMSRGRGISVYANLNLIKQAVGAELTTISSSRWVAQKYIERPLLIHGVKFDIRQWFVVTDWEQLTIWMYRRSYARFSTVPFTLEDLDGQIHLTNNAIQRKFSLSEDCHEDLPYEKMWFCEELDEYLASIGHVNSFRQKIYPAMKNILTQTCLAAQENAEPRRRSFELYGADFMLDEKLNPWLIEINQGPTLSIATTVTKELVESMLEDLCKVAIDRCREGETGDFERIFRQPTVEVPRYVGNKLTVEGKGYKKPKPPPKQYVREIKVPKKKLLEEGDAECNGKDGVSPSGSEEIIYKLYNWDVDRINRLAQPRIRNRESADQLVNPPNRDSSETTIKSNPKHLREISPRKKTSHSNMKSRSPTKQANRVSLSGDEYYLTQKQTKKTFEAKLAESADFGRGQIYPKSREYKHKGLEQLVYSSTTIEQPHVILDKPLKMRSEKTMRLTSDISMTLANVDVVQKRNDAAVYRWENLVPNSPKPIIPPKSTAKVNENNIAKWDVLLRNEAREKSLEMRPNYITGLPPARLRLQRERTAQSPAKQKKIPLTPSIYRVNGEHFRNRSLSTLHHDPYHSFVMPPGAILSGKVLQKQTRVGIPSSTMSSAARFNKEPKKMQIPL